jgi:hypothetical protein
VVLILISHRTLSTKINGYSIQNHLYESENGIHSNKLSVGGHIVCDYFA